MTHSFRDARLEEEFPDWGGLQPAAARIAFDDLTTYLDRPIEMIAADYWRYRAGEDIGASQRVAEATDEATVDAYYAKTPHYLYELSYWEASHGKQAWFRVLWLFAQRHGLQRILDFGGGVGGLSLYLSARSLRCGHLDVPGRTSEYAQWRFARHQHSIAMHDATTPAGLPQAAYDAVIAWDVLEHIFDLEGALCTVAKFLRPHGWFLSKSTFATGHENHSIHLAQHARYADVRKLNRLLEGCQFGYQGQLKPNRLSRMLRVCGLRYAVAGIKIAPRLKHGGNFLIHRLQ